MTRRNVTHVFAKPPGSISAPAPSLLSPFHRTLPAPHIRLSLNSLLTSPPTRTSDSVTFSRRREQPHPGKFDCSLDSSTRWFDRRDSTLVREKRCPGHDTSVSVGILIVGLTCAREQAPRGFGVVQAKGWEGSAVAILPRSMGKR